MMTDNTSMQNSIPHIEKAMRALEMLLVIVEGRFRLSPQKHMKTYYDSLIESVLAIQDTLVTDQEYTADLQLGIDKVSGTKAYNLSMTENHDGDQFYAIDAVLSLKEMKKNVAIGAAPRQVVDV